MKLGFSRDMSSSSVKPMGPVSVILSLAAGLLGGVVAPHIFPVTAVHAQAQTPPARIVEAGTFKLVNNAGHVAGTLAIDAAGSGVLTMFDADGKVIFTTSGDKPIIKPALAR
jgi:hypothetical protein